MGVEASQPVITEKMRAYNFTNEGGVFDTWRISKNIMGLWLIQECRRAWAQQGGNFDYSTITKLATDAKPFLAMIDPDDSLFFSPGSMPERICDYCRRTRQAVPQTEGEIARVILESIALKYHLTLERLEDVMGARLEPVHIIGGGSRNALLNQFTADATRRPVIAGPEEATTVGNILMQAIAKGALNNLEDARDVVRNSFTPQVFEPGPTERWDEAYDRLKILIEG
jgi:sugar (pentulose or hexulose) kinase